MQRRSVPPSCSVRLSAVPNCTPAAGCCWCSGGGTASRAVTAAPLSASRDAQYPLPAPSSVIGEGLALPMMAASAAAEGATKASHRAPQSRPTACQAWSAFRVFGSAASSSTDDAMQAASHQRDRSTCKSLQAPGRQGPPCPRLPAVSQDFLIPQDATACRTARGRSTLLTLSAAAGCPLKRTCAAAAAKAAGCSIFCLRFRPSAQSAK
mmetsp:Transcript_106203/g.317276  ORF Transcript_106203/g.317276 Transcript_106203/m.317276 type:complete len:209 (-) Transcript_106203:420-1046(-)